MRNLFIFLLILIATPILLVRLNRPLRQAKAYPIDQGAIYSRHVFSNPNIVAHVVQIDLTQTTATFKVTATDEANQFPPLKTTSFVNQFGHQIGINGSFYQINRQSGALVPIGVVISDGVVESNGRSRYPALCISANNQMSIERSGNCSAQTIQGIAGNVLVVDNGSPLDAHNSHFPGRANAFRPEPRTAVGLSDDGQTIWLIVVDGRQGNYSQGMTMNQLADFMVGLGVDTAVNLDGGGSSTLVTENWFGRARTVNSPVHNGIPTLQRPVPTHLGISLDAPETIAVINAD